MTGQHLFREESLRRVISPEGVDQAVPLVRRRTWVALIILGALCGIAVLWAIFGRVNEAVESNGVLLRPGRVRGLEAPFGGQVREVNVAVGQAVRAGEVLVVLGHPELAQQLQQARDRLRELRDQDMSQRKIEGRVRTDDDAVRASRRAAVERSIRETEQLLKGADETTRSAVKSQRDKLRENRTAAEAVQKTLTERAADARRLRSKNLITEEVAFNAELAVRENEQRLADLALKVAELELRDVELQQSRLTHEQRLGDLRVQLKELDLRADQTEQSESQMVAVRAVRLAEQEDLVKSLTERLSERGDIRARVAGHVVELTLSVGQTVPPGSLVGSLEASEESGEPLSVLAYFPVAAGKRVREGMEAHVTPATVRRERVGSIVGRVRRVSAYPVAERTSVAGVGNPELALGLRQAGGAIEVEVELETADTPSGFKWTSKGPAETFSPGTTASVRVVVERRAPISYLVPTARRWVYGIEPADGE